MRLDLSEDQITQQARRARARIAFRAAYGYAKLRDLARRRRWLGVALHNDPAGVV